MADKLHKRPSKGILKNSSSFDKQDARSGPANKKSKETKWDEMNIIATLHPADKDYGHMKIDEPKTPYNYEDPDNENLDVLDATELAEKIRLGTAKLPKALQSQSSEDDDDEEDEDLSPEARAKKKEFESKRKKHYNEFYAIKLARKLLEEEDEDEDDKNSKASGSTPKQDRPSASNTSNSIVTENCSNISE